MERRLLAAPEEGCPESRQVGGRMGERGRAYQLVSSHSHSIAKHRDRQTPWRDRWTDEECLFGDSLCLHLQWRRKRLKKEQKKPPSEGDLTALYGSEPDYRAKLFTLSSSPPWICCSTTCTALTAPSSHAGCVITRGGSGCALQRKTVQ